MILFDSKRAQEKKPGNWKIEIADKDIPVYKLIRAVHGDSSKWEAFHMKIVYPKNTRLKACEHLEILHEFDKLGYDSIRCGFHSYLGNDYPELSNAIIPKGAEYCVNLYGEVVSNEIIVCSSTLNQNQK